MAAPVLSNALARRVFLDRHALLEPPAGPARGAALLALIRRLGFVQVDSINTVERAHNMILWSRRQSFRPADLRRLLERDRDLFEHWTHDAAILPAEFWPHWTLRFARDRARIAARWRRWHGPDFQDRVAEVRDHIRRDGPVGTREVGAGERRGSGGWWEWHPSKTALEYLWRTGEICVCHRRGFAKVYDLAERVLPAPHRVPAPGEAETIDWACSGALERLGFATPGEITAFWDLVTPAEARAWCDREARAGRLEEVAIGTADGGRRRCLARPGLAEAAAALPEPPGRVRILSPFDPALRDRGRAERLFGFRYRIEVFVPEARRRYGYYVFPVMERDRLIGRLDARCRREAGVLAVRAFWPERGIAMGSGRLSRLGAELERLGRFTGCREIRFDEGWLRPPGS